MTLNKALLISKSKHARETVRNIISETIFADTLHEAIQVVDTVQPDVLIVDEIFSDDLNKHAPFHKQSKPLPLVILTEKDAHYDDLKHEPVYTASKKKNISLENTLHKIRFDRVFAGEEKNYDDFFLEEWAASVNLVGKSPAMKNALHKIKLVATSQCNPILINGQTGTGKELAALAIHKLRHANKPFVAVNCAALTSNLLESELFGHARGSFTGADREKTGLLELAANGTIFLDEISEMPLDLQAKLLRVIQEKNFRKVGGTTDIPCQATIIASSNRQLQKEVEANRFRRDLFYRLNIFPVQMPPLSSNNRKEDIPLLAEYFLQTSTICPDKQNKIQTLTQMAINSLNKHLWPGNVRELRNVIDRAIMLETTDKIGLSSIIIDTDEEHSVETPSTPLEKISDFSLQRAERELIAKALEETNWQKTQAASLLGITRATLYAKVKQYNIEKGTNPENKSESNAKQTEEVLTV